MVAWVPTSLVAQAESPPEGNRKWLFGVVGGVVVGVPAYLSSDVGVGRCNSKNCFAPIAATVGAIAGFLLGAEVDSNAAQRWVAGPKVELSASEHEVPFAADFLVSIPGGVALLGPSGMARASASGVTSTHAARGLLAAAVLAKHKTVLVSSASAILAFDQNESVRGARRAFAEGGSALAVDHESRVVLGGEGTLRLLRAEGEGNSVTFVEEAVAPDPEPAREITWSGDVLWELAGRRVASRSTDSLAQLGATALPGPGRALAVSGSIGVVAAGESGVAVLDLSDPTLPFVTALYEGVRYAYDIELVGHEAFVTAGEQGLVRLDLSDPTKPVVTGVVGNLGRPFAVVRSGGSLYVLDREDRELHVIDVGEENTPAN
jgi:hypothetical protein